MSHRLAILSLLLATVLPAQSSLRGWGAYGCFDTESRDEAASFVSAEVFNTVVVSASGSLYVQGHNNDRLFDPPPAPSGLRYTRAYVSADFGIAELSDGSLVQWGGSGIYAPPTIPVLPPGMSYVDFAVGINHALFLRSDGQILGIGNDVHGQLQVPQFPVGTSVIKLVGGPGTSAAILSDGSLWCWGVNTNGQCDVPPLPAGLTYTDVSLGYLHTMAIRSDGSMVVFGMNAGGLTTVPPLPPGVTWTMCAAGAGHCIGLRSDGVLAGWGDNTYNQQEFPTPSAPIVALDTAAYHSVMLCADGRYFIWGYSGYFLGDLVELPGAFDGYATERFADLAVGQAHCLARLSNGDWVSFGVAGLGQRDLPLLPSGLHYRKVIAGRYRSAAIRSDGELVIFADSCGAACTPPPLPAGTAYVDAALSTNHTVALRSDGVAVAFGSNGWGVSTIPPLPPGTTYRAVDAYYGRTALLRSDSVVRSLGSSSSALWPEPTAEPGVEFVDVVVCDTFDSVLRSDGEVVAWGSIGSSFQDPPALPWGLYYVEIEGGHRWLAMRRSDGTVHAAGRDFIAYVDAPALKPGTSYLQLSGSDDVLGARVGVTSTYVGIGHGCAGSEQAARIVPADTPRIGRTFAANVFDLPADLAVLAMSFSTPASPIALDPLGMPGCSWHIGVDATALLSGSDGTAHFELAIPDQLALVGVRFQHQALVLDPSGINGFGAVVSDAMEGVVGKP